jgi:hypothetical protein
VQFIALGLLHTCQKVQSLYKSLVISTVYAIRTMSQRWYTISRLGEYLYLCFGEVFKAADFTVYLVLLYDLE